MKLLPAVLSALTISTASYAQQSDICSSHTVTRGETLRIIAERYLGTREQSPVIYRANRSVVGGDPNLILVGMVLNIPCAAGQTGGQTVVASATAAAPAAPAPAPVEPAPIETASASATRSLTAPEASAASAEFTGGLIALLSESPFTGADLPNGGAMPTVMAQALVRAGEGMPAVSLSTLGNARSLEVMYQDARLEVAFPVIRPNCFSASLTNTSRMLCNDFYFSAPMFEVVTTLFSRASDGLEISSAEDMADLVVCLPDFYPWEELQDLGLALNMETMVEPGSIAECFDMLWSGDADLVYADFLSVDATIGNIDLRGDLVTLSRFTWIKTVHAVSHNGNAEGVNMLSKLNEGFANMVSSGEWRAMMRDLLS
ncbi:MAG: LysM peptidoglycan-binding domain-containing protein [Paracoccaceae bacterium]